MRVKIMCSRDCADCVVGLDGKGVGTKGELFDGSAIPMNANDELLYPSIADMQKSLEENCPHEGAPEPDEDKITRLTAELANIVGKSIGASPKPKEEEGTEIEKDIIIA